MNDGSYAVLCYFLLLFFYIGGWYQDELREERWKGKWIFFFLLFSLIAPFYSFSIASITVTATIFLPPLLVSILILKKERDVQLRLFSGCILIGVLFFLTQELFIIDPIIMIVDPRLVIGVSFGIIVSFFSLSLIKKILLILLGFPMGWSFFIIYHQEFIPYRVIGTLYEMDEILITIVCLAIVHIPIRIFNQAYIKFWRNPLKIDKAYVKNEK